MLYDGECGFCSRLVRIWETFFTAMDLAHQSSKHPGLNNASASRKSSCYMTSVCSRTTGSSFPAPVYIYKLGGAFGGLGRSGPSSVSLGSTSACVPATGGSRVTGTAFRERAASRAESPHDHPVMTFL